MELDESIETEAILWMKGMIISSQFWARREPIVWTSQWRVLKDLEAVRNPLRRSLTVFQVRRTMMKAINVERGLGRRRRTSAKLQGRLQQKFLPKRIKFAVTKPAGRSSNLLEERT
jgi:hypothetical protein